MGAFIEKHDEYIENRSRKKCSYCNRKVTPKTINNFKISVGKFNIGLKYKCKCGKKWTDKTNII